MTKQEFALFAAALKTYYSKEEKLLPNTAAMRLWFEQLQDIPYPLANAVLQKWVSTQKWSPSIAEIREQAVLIQNGPTPSWGEGWEAVRKAIRRYGIYNQQEAMESLSGITKEAVRYLGFRNLCLSENETSDRARFEQIYQVLEKRQREDVQNACGGCSWSRRLEPVEGWTAVRRDIHNNTWPNTEMVSYRISDCPEYVPDEPRE